MMNCREVANNRYEYLDRELSTDEIRTVKEHLQCCHDCFELVAFESGVIKLVRRDCGSVKAPDHLRERIQQITRG